LKDLLRNRKSNMSLAAIFGIYLLSMGWLAPAVGAPSRQPAAGQTESSPQTPPSLTQNTDSPQASPSPEGKEGDSASPAKPSRPQRRRNKKNVPNCTTAATALNPVANPTDSGNPNAAGSTSSSPSSPNSGSSADSAKTGLAKADSAKAGSVTLPPCPPPKKVVRNGGSNEPTIQLLGGSPADQASNQRSTEQLTAATEENLKKIADRQLPPARQEMVNQVKQFMDQSKTAVAKGDLERGHNLARKAQLLSEELLRP
jgi:hypothetical protein